LKRNLDKNKQEKVKYKKTIKQKKAQFAQVSQFETTLAQKRDQLSKLKMGFKEDTILEEIKKLDIDKKKIDEKIKENTLSLNTLNQSATQRNELNRLDKNKEEAEQKYNDRFAANKKRF